MRTITTDLSRFNRTDGSISYYAEPVFDSDLNVIEVSHLCDIEKGLVAKQGHIVTINSSEQYVLANPLDNSVLCSIVCRGTEFMDSQTKISTYEGDVPYATTVIDPAIKDGLRSGEGLVPLKGILTKKSAITKAALIEVYGDTAPDGTDLQALVDDAAAQALIGRTLFTVMKTGYKPIIQRRSPINHRVDDRNYRVVIKRTV